MLNFKMENKNLRRQIYDIGIGNDFLNTTPKIQLKKNL